MGLCVFALETDDGGLHASMGSRRDRSGPEHPGNWSGPGISTDILRARVTSLTCVEIDCRLADSLKRRTAGTNVTVVREDATAMSFENDLFDATLSLTMLHHIPSASLDDCLLREILRVLRPGGIFAGVDSYGYFGRMESLREWIACNSRIFGLLRIFDTMTIVDPKTFPNRLLSAGFVDTVSVRSGRLGFGLGFQCTSRRRTVRKVGISRFGRDFQGAASAVFSTVSFRFGCAQQVWSPTDRDPAVEVLANHDRATRQRVPKARLGQLQITVL
jgi:SAM-dependent methyltransferase